MESPLLIHQNVELAVRIGGNQIRKAVAIQVRHRATESEETRRRRNGWEGHRGEFPIMLVKEHLVPVGRPDGQVEETIMVEVRHLRVKYLCFCQRCARLPL